MGKPVFRSTEFGCDVPLPECVVGSECAENDPIYVKGMAELEKSLPRPRPLRPVVFYEGPAGRDDIGCRGLNF